MLSTFLQHARALGCDTSLTSGDSRKRRALPRPTRPHDPLPPLTGYDVEDLPALGELTIESVGSENVYFTVVSTGEQAYCKPCFSPTALVDADAALHKVVAQLAEIVAANDDGEPVAGRSVAP